MVQAVILFLVGLALICLGGDRLVDAAVAIARKLGIPQIVVGATIVSIGTTLPEVLVSTTAAFDGSAAIAAGNAFGSIICNTALIAGVTQTIRPSRKVEFASLGWRSIFFFAVLVTMDVIGFVTGAFGRPVGIGLILLFVFYAAISIKRASVEGGSEEAEESKDGISIPKELLKLVVCAVMLFFGARLLVNNGIIIAEAIGVPERVIAVTFIALGTSLPELVTTLTAIAKKEASMSVGNIIGANVIDLTMILPVCSAVSGGRLTIGSQTTALDLPACLLLCCVAVLPPLFKGKFYRWQGVLMLAVYAAYVVILVM